MGGKPSKKSLIKETTDEKYFGFVRVTNSITKPLQQKYGLIESGIFCLYDDSDCNTLYTQIDLAYSDVQKYKPDKYENKYFSIHVTRDFYTVTQEDLYIFYSEDVNEIECWLLGLNNAIHKLKIHCLYKKENAHIIAQIKNDQQVLEETTRNPLLFGRELCIFCYCILLAHDFLPLDVISFIVHILMLKTKNTILFNTRSNSSFIIYGNDLYACGNNAHKQLGLGNDTFPTVRLFERVKIPREIGSELSLLPFQIASGAEHTVLIMRSKNGLNTELFGCGHTKEGQLGLNVLAHERNLPDKIIIPFFQKIDLIKNPIQVSCGEKHTMVLTEKGVFGFGFNLNGQLGTTDFAMKHRPEIINIKNIISVQCGDNFSMMLNEDGFVFCCGSNKGGALGIGEFESKFIERPTKIPIRKVLSVHCGSEHTMILNTDGLYCCGSNINGQLGLDSPKTKFNSFQRINIINYKNIISISCGSQYTLFLNNTGTLFGCGSNSSSQLGVPKLDHDASFKNSHIHTRKIIKIEERVSAVATGINHTIIETGFGKLAICGSNSNGQTGTISSEKILSTFIHAEIPYYL